MLPFRGFIINIWKSNAPIQIKKHFPRKMRIFNSLFSQTPRRYRDGSNIEMQKDIRTGGLRCSGLPRYRDAFFHHRRRLLSLRYVRPIPNDGDLSGDDTLYCRKREKADDPFYPVSRFCLEKPTSGWNEPMTPVVCDK